MRTRAIGAVSCLVVAGWVFACGSEDGGETVGGTGGSSASGGGGAGGTAGGGATSGGGAGGTSGSAAGGAAATAGTSGTGGAGGTGNGGWGADAGWPDVSFGYDAKPEQDGAVGDACAATTAKADPKPLDMYIMLDKSGSMGTDCNIGSSTASKWCYAVQALNGYFISPSSSGMGVAIQYFPISGLSCTGSGGTEATPAVPLGLLPGIVGQLQNSLNATVPNGSNTPTEAGIRGLIDYTGKNKQPNRVMIGILITDGLPNACNTGGSYMAGLLQAHYNATGVRTFVIGMTGASFTTLEQIATGGGTAQHPDNMGAGLTDACGNGGGPCYHWNVGNGNPQAFIQALQAIQQSAVACQYNMPKSDAGIVDPAKVEVQLTPGTGTPQKLTHVASAAGCGSTEGWYYDNNTNPQTILLCPAACTKAQSDTKAQIDILLGCLGS